MKFSKRLLNKVVLIILLAISAYLLYYSFYRSLHLSFTHDESYSYFRYMHNVVYKIILNYNQSANNHILNTLFMKMFGAIFNENEIFLRLHSNIAHIIYIIFSILIVKEFRNPLLKIAGFTILNLNPYMLDFFSLARGYGLVFMFIMTSLFYFFRFVKDDKIKHLTWSIVLAGLSVYSNFTALYYFSSLVFVATLILIFKGISERHKLNNILYNVFIKNRSIWITVIVLAFLIYIPIAKLSRSNELYGHGHSGFWQSTILSVLQASFYHVQYNFLNPKLLLTLEKILSGIFLFSTIYIIIKDRWQAIRNPFVLMFFIFFSAAGFELLHHLITGTQFIALRAAIYFQILFWVLFMFWLRVLIDLFGKPAIYFSVVVSLPIAIAFLLHFNRTRNFERTYEWGYDADTKNMIKDLVNNIENKEKTYKLGINWVFEPAINYYINSRDYTFIEPVTRLGVFNEDYDFYYVFKDNFSYAVTQGMDIISTYDVSNSMLTRNLCLATITSENFEIFNKDQQLDSFYIAEAKKLTNMGMQNAENKTSIYILHELSQNTFYLGIYSNRVLSFKNSGIVGRSEPNHDCEFKLEPIPDFEDTYYIHNANREYLTTIGDRLTISKSAKDDRLMVKMLK